MLSQVLSKVLAVFLFVMVARAQDHHHDEGTAAAQPLGSVSFPISCPARDQKDFNRGIALLHSFSYKNARVQFQQIEQRNPSCAMAYWGDAMSLYRQLWDRPTAKELAQGFKLIQQAKAAPIQTAREHAFINAAAGFYDDNPSVTYETRRNVYSEAMRRLQTSSPKDDEASLFYALSLLTSPDAKRDNFATTREAIVVINDVFTRQPNHPGAAHYLIHACDNPVLATQALTAARRYAQIAPASPHAVHMPSHIFARLGIVG